MQTIRLDRALVQPTTRDDVIASMQGWFEEFVEQPHQVVGGLPVCPFAKAARLNKTIQFEVMPFDAADPLHHDGTILTLVREFPRHQELETLFVIHPDQRQISAHALEGFVSRLNDRMAAEPSIRHLQAFEAHPASEFRIGGLYTRRSPYPSFQVLSRALLKAASDSLLGSPYYDHFTPSMLEMVGMPRDDMKGKPNDVG
jgi:hypothetical protein